MMMRRAAAALAVLPAVALAASVECPCINPWEGVAADAECADPANPFAALGLSAVAGDTTCVARDYGADECRAWDVDNAQCQQSPKPEWCSNAWCYVDPSNCRRPNDASSAFPDHDVDGLSYSYETCGNINSYLDMGSRFTWLRGKELRVSMPGDSSSGYTLVTDPDGGRNGSVYTFMQKVAVDAGFSWVEKPITAASRARFNTSSFTACVHDVALNETDMCIGNFWMTPQRLHMAAFTQTIYDDSFSLVARARGSEDPTWDYYFAKPLKPFSMGAWAGIIGCVMYMSTAMIVIESNSAQEESTENLEVMLNLLEEREEAVTGRGCCARVRRWFYHKARKGILAGDAHDWTAYRTLEHIDMIINGVARSAFYGVLGLTSGSPSHEPKSLPGRLVVAGFAFFLVVIFSSYTAGILNALLQTEALVQLNFEDLQRDGDKVCVVSAAAVAFKLRYPEMVPQVIEVPNAAAGLDSIGTKCRAAVVMYDAWERFSNQHCDLMASTESAAVMFVPNAMPVRDELVEPISYFITRAIQEQQYKKAKDDAHVFATSAGRLPAINLCAADKERKQEEVGGADIMQMKPTDFIASYMVTIGCTTIGLMVFFGCGYAYDATDKNTRTLQGALDGDDMESRNKLRKMSISQLRDIALQHAPRQAGNTDEIDPEFKKAIQAAVNEAPNATRLIGLVLDCDCEFGGSKRGTLKRNLRKLTITKLLHRAKNSGVKKSERKIALDSLFPHDALSIIILEKEYPEGSDGTHQSNRSLADETLEEKTNRETAAAALARNHPLLDAGHCNEPLGELPGRESEMTTVSGEFFNADAEEMANPVADAPLGEADKGEADKDVA